MHRVCIGTCRIFYFSLLSFCTAIRAIEPGIAGDYDRVILAEQKNYVTGVFSDCTAECKFSCIFFFEGERQGNPFSVTARLLNSGGTIMGEATLTGKKLRLRLRELPDGCWNVEPEIHKSGAEVLQNSAEPWLQIRLTRRAANVAQRPNGKNAWQLSENEAVIVLQDRGAWLKIRKPSGDARSGWVRQADLQQLRIHGHDRYR